MLLKREKLIMGLALSMGFLWFGGHPGSAQDLLLPLCSGVTPGGLWWHRWSWTSNPGQQVPHRLYYLSSQELLEVQCQG